jgi:diguanylate cyclase (GGDEF)-like protein
LLYLDLDGFKMINDTYGHEAGDRLLELVAERLRTIIQEHDLAARLGGDEFVVLLPECSADDALSISHRIIDAIGVPYNLGPMALARVGVSVGVAIAPQHAVTPTELLRAADGALYQAKSGGGARFQLAICPADLTLRRPQAEAHLIAMDNAAA